MAAEISYERFAGEHVTTEMLDAAAKLFSAHYGVWGSLAAERVGAFARSQQRIRMSAARLRQQCLPIGAESACVYTRAFAVGQLIGNAFAYHWNIDGQPICWITQLVVHSAYREQGIATKMLSLLCQPDVTVYGIMSSHAHACMAAIRAFSGSLKGLDLQFMKTNAAKVLDSSPVDYVRTARLHGALFDDETRDGAVSTVDTGFYVDHTEPLSALNSVCKAGIAWPFGELPEGHEFLVIVKRPSQRLDGAHDSSEF